MSANRGKLVRLVLVLAAALAGALIGLGLMADGLPPPGRTVRATYPLPHQIPRYPGGVALSFAMVHDVIHERFARHGKAYYRERDRLVRRALVKEKAGRSGGKPSRRYFELLDDLGVGLDHLGRHDEAVRLMRDKLKEQEAAGLKGRELYTTYANLGTFLIHGNFARARDGDAAAKGRLREGLGFIHRSIEVNPQAHFGREVWQAAAVEFFLAALDDPELLLTYDLVGNRLVRELTMRQGRQRALVRVFDLPVGMIRQGEPTTEEIGRDVASCLQSPNEAEAKRLRGFIQHLSPGWGRKLKVSHPDSVPFDEPVLGVIGMWRLGGGANPHFALMLGETMLRVGQRHIAWCAYERAVRLQDRFWPDAGLQERFVAHCRVRQQAILNELSARERDELPRRFEQELAYGQRYQEAYQRYQEQRIAAGASLDDPHFYDDFHARHGRIASPPGGADFFDILHETPFDNAAVPVLGAGVFAFATALLLRVSLRRRAAIKAG
jgi:hypothetical protein